MSDLIQIGIDVKTNIKQATSDLDKMGGSVVNNIRTLDRLESEIKQLNKALDAGRLTENAYRKGMQQVNGELLLFQQRAAKAAQVEQKFGAAAATGGKSLNRFNMTLQQGGYQLQDFIVQLQGGTSFFTAFSQQGSQFASIFGPKGAVIGAVIALGSAIGGTLVASIFNANGEVKDFSDQLKETTSVLDEYFSLLKQNDSAFYEAFEGNADAMRSTSQAAKDLLAISKIRAFDSIKQLGQSLADASTEAGFFQKIMFNTDRVVTGDLLNIETGLRGNITVWKDAGKEVQTFIDAVRNIGKADSIEGMYQSALKARDIFQQTVDITGEMTDEQKSFMEQISETILKLEMLGAVTTTQVAGTRNLKKEQKEINELLEVGRKATLAKNSEGRKTIIALENELKLAKTAAEFGKDSVEVVRLRAEQEAISLNLTTDNQKKYVELALASHEVAEGVAQAKVEAKGLEQALKAAASAMASLTGFGDGLDKKIAQAAAKVDALREGSNAANASMIAGLRMEAQQRRDTAASVAVGADQIRQINAEYDESISKIDELEGLKNTADAIEKANRAAAKSTKGLGKATNELVDEALRLNEANDPLLKFNNGVAKLNKLMATGKLTQKAYNAEVAKLQDGLADSVPIIGQVSDAFADFVGRGFKDFKGFVNSILDSFKNMLIKMIAMAARNKIMLSVNMGGSTLAGQAAAGQLAGVGAPVGGGMMGTFLGGFGTAGAAGTGLLGGVGASLGGFASGGLAGGFGAIGSAVSGVGAASGFMGTLGAVGTAIGAIAAPLLAVAAVFSFFKKKTKELDSGLQGTITTLDATIESFNVIQTKRFWGLSKKVSTSAEALDAEAAQPLIDAITAIQKSAIDAAGSLGIASDVFDNFIYDLEISLKGLTEEEKIQKVNEELAKMGDEFASLTNIFSNMSELLAVAQQRYELEVQLLQVQGDVVELRRMELEAIHVLNRGLAARLQLLQAEGDLQGALGAFASGISQQQNLIRSAVDALVTPLIEAIDRTRSQAEKSYQIFRNAADKTRDEAENIVDIITGALESRTIRSEAVERMRYTQAQQQLASFAGGASFDEASLRRATEGVSIDTTKFFGSFEDYARDFYKTQISLTKLAEKAEGELTDVEKQIDVAEKAYQVAMGTYQETQDFNVALNTLLTDLATFTEVSARNEPFIDQIKAEGDRQVELLDQVLVETTKQINALLGIENTIADLVGSNVSVGEALSVLGLEGGELAGAVLALEPTVGAIGSHIEGLDLTLGGAIDRLGLTLNELKGLDLSKGFLSLDLTSGLETNISGLNTGVSALDTAASGLNLGVVGLDGTVGVLSSSVDKEAANLLTLNGTVVKQTVAVDTLTGQVSTLTSNVVNLDGTVYGLGTNVTGLGTNVSGLGTNVSNLGVSTDNLGININDLGATLSNAMSGLGSIVSSLSGAVSGLAASNNALAAAQQAQAKASADAAAALAQAAKDAEINQLQEAGAGIKTGGNVIGDKSGNIVIVYDDGTRSGPVSGSGGNSAALTAYYQVKDSEAKAEALRKQIEDLGGTPTFASGGMHSGGMRLVGEQGPELEVTGPSRIYSAQQTKNMLSGGSGEVVSELRSLRREVSEMKAEQRKIGVENVKYNKKSYDLNREWDIVGLPATRTS